MISEAIVVPIKKSIACFFLLTLCSSCIWKLTSQTILGLHVQNANDIGNIMKVRNALWRPSTLLTKIRRGSPILVTTKEIELASKISSIWYLRGRLILESIL